MNALPQTDRYKNNHQTYVRKKNDIKVQYLTKLHLKKRMVQTWNKNIDGYTIVYGRMNNIIS